MSDGLLVGGANPWRTLASVIVYDNGELRLREDDVVQPNGDPGTYTFIEVPKPVVAVVPLSDDGCVHLVRQWRYPWGRNSWEIPAGHCENDEEPLVGARRELAEEVGLGAESWEPLGQGFGSAAMTAQYHMFLARNLSPTTDLVTRDGAEYDLISKQVPLEEAVRAALDGTIVHVLSVVGLLRAARRLGI